MTKSSDYKFTSYEIRNKLGIGLTIFFAFLALLYVNIVTEESYVILGALSGLAFSGAVFLFYNDYKFNFYDKIKERLLSMTAILLLALIYWIFWGGVN